MKNGTARLYSDAEGWKPVESVSNMEEKNVFFPIQWTFACDVHIETPAFTPNIVNLLAPELFFLILAHSVYKMWIIQEPNKLELWNKLHFKEKKTESIHHV